MMSDAPKVDISALAKLARLNVSAEELARLETEIPAILGFVQTIQKAATAAKPEAVLKNVLRADEHPHKSSIYTERLLTAAPAREGDRIAVKQVISRKK